MFGKPEAVLSDNGVQWTSMKELNAGLMSSAMNWESNTCSKLYKPTTQGKIKRYHCNIKTEAYLPDLKADLATYKKAILEYIEFYNSERPHFSLNMKIPCNIYLAGFKLSESIL